MTGRCILAMAGGAILTGGGGTAVGANLAIYLIPGAPSVTGVAIVLLLTLIGAVGGILMAMVQFYGR